MKARASSLFGAADEGSRLSRILNNTAGATAKALSFIPPNPIDAVKGGVKSAVEYLAENPDASEAKSLFDDLKSKAGMTTEQREALDVMEALGSDATPEKIQEAKDLLRSGNKSPTKVVAEVKGKSGKAVSVEKKVTRGMEGSQEAIQKHMDKEEGGMNIPLLMAGVAMMQSKGDPFEAIGEGFDAFMQSKEGIEAKKAAKDDKQFERMLKLEELGINKAKLDLMKQENLQLDSKNVDSVKNITDIQTEYQNLLYITQVLIL
jgi:hypothetical protein